MTQAVWYLGLKPSGVGRIGAEREVELPGTQYKIRIYDTSGTLVAEVIDFLQLAYRKVVNEPGLCQFLLPGDHDAVDLLDNKYQIEIWRRNPRHEIEWYPDFHGLFMDQERFYDRQPFFVANCPGQMSMLGWRYVMWAAGTSNRSTFSSHNAETIMKWLVSYNIGPNATTDQGRVRDGYITGISTAGNYNRGYDLDWNCAWKNLLSELQSIARVGNGDFDLNKTGAATWRFEFYENQRGVDRSETVKFSLDHGNMGYPRYRYNRALERTVAVVAGRGQGDARLTETRTGPDYSATNDIEVFLDARSFSTTTGLQKAGDEKLEIYRARQELVFNVIQTPASMYGKHYCVDGIMGDLVTSRYDDIEVTQKITAVTVALERGGGEQIDVETETQ